MHNIFPPSCLTMFPSFNLLNSISSQWSTMLCLEHIRIPIGLFLGFIFHPFLFFVFRSILLYHLDFRINHSCYQKHTYNCWNFNQIESNLCRNLKRIFVFLCSYLLILKCVLVFGPLQFLYIVLTHIFVSFIPRWFIFFCSYCKWCLFKNVVFMLFVVCI